MGDALSIPTLDLDDLDGNEERRQRAAEAIRVGFGTFGLIYIKSHHVDAAELSKLYDEFDAFAARPESEKRKVSGDDIWFQRGWTPPNTERAVVSGGEPDFKECYFAAPLPVDPECKLEYPQIYADNLFPPDSESFSESYLSVGRQLHEAGLSVLQASALALGLPADLFNGMVEGGPHVFRLLRYLPLDAEQATRGVLWGEEHTDFNLVTLLPGGRFHDLHGKPCARPDDASGLYLRTRPDADHPRGAKVQGVAPPGCIVAQVGQQLEILSGGQFLATPHVITAPKTPGYSRFSAAHFVHLHSHQMVFPLSEFRTPETIRAYSPPVLAGTYGIKTLVDIGLAPPEALNRIGYRHYDRLAGMRAAEQGKPG